MSGTIIQGGPRVPAELVTDSGVNVEQDASIVVHGARTIDFEGAGVAVTNVAGVATVTIAGGGSGIAVDENGAPVVTVATIIDFIGDGVTVANAGAGRATVTIPGGGGGGSIPTGRYTATGEENPAGFPIVFAALTPPIVSADTNFNAIVSGGGLAFGQTFDCPVVDYLTTGITVVPSSALTAADVLIVTIIPFTP